MSSNEIADLIADESLIVRIRGVRNTIELERPRNYPRDTAMSMDMPWTFTRTKSYTQPSLGRHCYASSGAIKPLIPFCDHTACGCMMMLLVRSRNIAKPDITQIML